MGLWDHIKFTIGCVGEKPKVGEGKQQGGLGNKDGKTERRGDKGPVTCNQAIVLFTFVIKPCARQPQSF